MRRLIGAVAFASTLTGITLAGPNMPGATADSARPMQFTLRTEGPSGACADKCRVWVAASGMIRPETVTDFEAFAQKNDIRGATIALESEGGSVLGAIALGRSIRRLAMTTTVGRAEGPANSRAAVVAARRLRIHVRLRPAFGREALRASGRAHSRPPDLARRPARGCDRLGLLGGRPCRGPARHRQARSIHRGDGRDGRTARSLACAFRRGSRCALSRATNCGACASTTSKSPRVVSPRFRAERFRPRSRMRARFRSQPSGAGRSPNAPAP